MQNFEFTLTLYFVRFCFVLPLTVKESLKIIYSVEQNTEFKSKFQCYIAEFMLTEEEK